jgi:predicted RNase H-like nuclease (RuvC/YqgF family)
MMLYVLIGLSLSLLGVAGLQFFYLIYLEQIDCQQKKRICELERHCKSLTNHIHEAEAKIAEQRHIIENVFDEFDEIEEEEEVWADVIEDR